MKIGVPCEIKPREGRVALVPEALAELLAAGHEVRIQAGAGAAAGFSDAQYQALGARVVADAATLYGESTLIVKVKEPVAGDLDLLRAHHRLFCYLHLAAQPALAKRLCQIGLTAVAFETVAEADGLPLLTPMSLIAGRVAVQQAAILLQRPAGGRGLLLGGVPGTPRGRVVVLGAGQAGSAAVELALGMGAQVTVFDRAPRRLAAMAGLGPAVTALYPYGERLDTAVRYADVLIGAVLIPGASAPRLVSREQVVAMKPGAVIVDIAVDQGGCIETTRATDYTAPTYVEAGVIHFCVTNMPGAVPRTASQALSAALLPYVQRLSTADWRSDPALAAGLNVAEGELRHPAVRAALAH